MEWAILVVALGVPPYRAMADEPTPLGSAMTSVFSPAKAPQRKTMGLFQRSFLDLAASGDQELEVAIVVDGTESMATELAAVRRSIHQMLSDLRKYRDNEVRAAIVVYRDVGAPSGEVVIPQPTFTDNTDEIERAVAALVPESGAPYFHELVDLGLYKAIQDLPWTPDDRVSKWVLLFGDAPPYSEARAEKPAREGKRRFGTDLLVGAAKANGIRVSCVLCTSSENVSATYQQAVDETRTFMNRLASGTDGLMLDLSSPRIRTALLEAGKRPDVAYTKIQPITAIELASVRRESSTKQGEETDQQLKTVRLAVLPHLPLAQVRNVGLNPNSQAVQVCTALRTRLSQLKGVRVASPLEIQRQLRRLRARAGDSRQTLRGLASRLGVDYVVWGEPVSGSAFQTAAYRRDTGQQVMRVLLPNDKDQGTWAHLFLTAAAEQAEEGEAIGQLLNAAGEDSEINQPMSESPSTTADLLAAIESLAHATEFAVGDEAAVDWLSKAAAASRAAANAEPRNPLPHWLQANIAYNQAAGLFQAGEREQAFARMREMKSELNRAFGLRERVRLPSLRTEIEADYLLLNRKDVAAAVRRYQQLTEPGQPLASQLRGHWMLSGIYAGDWGTAEQITVDPNKARTHVMEVMANWPDSPQAALLKRWLKFDPDSEQTRFNYLPMVNVELTAT